MNLKCHLICAVEKKYKNIFNQKKVYRIRRQLQTSQIGILHVCKFSAATQPTNNGKQKRSHTPH